MTQLQPRGGPYLSNAASVGGAPTTSIDVPILCVFLCLYILGAASNMTIFQLNRRQGHKFFMSWAMFGFCMARTATCILRIAWTYHLHNIRLAIAAGIFLNAGVLVAYIVVLLLSTRILRATQPRWGWNSYLRSTFKVLYAALLVAILLVISFTVLSFYTLNPELKTAALWIQRVAVLYMLIFNIISTVLLLLSAILPRSSEAEDFGTGSMASKLLIAGLANFFCLFIAGFRCGTAWADPRLASDPAWYDSKAAFYVIELGFEIVVIYLFIVVRFDRRFWVPNGSKGPGDYSAFERKGDDKDDMEEIKRKNFKSCNGC